MAEDPTSLSLHGTGTECQCHANSTLTYLEYIITLPLNNFLLLLPSSDNNPLVPHTLGWEGWWGSAISDLLTQSSQQKNATISEIGVFIYEWMNKEEIIKQVLNCILFLLMYTYTHHVPFNYLIACRAIDSSFKNSAAHIHNFGFISRIHVHKFPDTA